MIDIKLGEYAEKGIETIAISWEPLFDAIAISIETLVESIQAVLNWPHPAVAPVAYALLAYVLLSRPYGFFSKKGWQAGRGLTLFTVSGLFLIYGLGFWQETMETLALVISSALISLLLGIPLGLASSRSDRLEKIIRPALDLMQTMPAFVYLIPAILFFSVGNVPGVVATVVFSLPPGVRLTNLGIREVQEDVIEAARAFGCTDWQLLVKVQIPLALPTIMAGVNQVIMLSLSMVVIASMVGAAGLGERVYAGILQAKMGLGFEAGLCIVIIAIFLDRITQALGVAKN